MSLFRSGERLCFDVLAAFRYHPGQGPKKRGEAKPALRIRLTTAVPRKRWFGRLVSSGKSAGGWMPEIGHDAIVDTGARVSLISSDYLYQWGLLEGARWDDFPKGHVILADGNRLEGRLATIKVQVLPLLSVVELDFLIIQKRVDYPVMLNWHDLKSSFSLVLLHDQLAVCRRTSS